MILGEYRPRVLLISTPSEFSSALSPFDASPSLTSFPRSEHRLRLQPKVRSGRKRSERISRPYWQDVSSFQVSSSRLSVRRVNAFLTCFLFPLLPSLFQIRRHDGHKFEWTPTEFASYCLGIAEEFGYECTPTLIGPPTTSEPPPIPSSSHATNACLFRLSPTTTNRASRRTSRSFRTSSLPFLHPEDPTTRSPSQHRLVKRVSILAREEAGKPAEGEEIRELLRQTMRNWKVGEVGLTSVWMEMAGVCGGSMRELVQVSFSISLRRV